jgi:hypothetical protein
MPSYCLLIQSTSRHLLVNSIAIGAESLDSKVSRICNGSVKAYHQLETARVSPITAALIPSRLATDVTVSAGISVTLWRGQRLFGCCCLVRIEGFSNMETTKGDRSS